MEGDGKMKKKNVVIRMPEWAWELMTETLWMDSESGMFDCDLREDLKTALETYEYLYEEDVEDEY